MAIIEAIHSIEKGAEVYHNNSECTERNNIETRNVRAGNGNKRLCAHCAKLNATPLNVPGAIWNFMNRRK